MNALPAREAYRLWAPSYESETVVSHLENLTVAELGVPVAGAALLDVGCGTARRLHDTGARLAVGVDVVPEMLRAARDASCLAAADIRALPLAGGRFDVVWCRLMIGHVRDIAAAYRELSRVCGRRGVVIISDLAPAAAAAGHRRTFRDAGGTVHEVEHFAHSIELQAAVAHDAGLRLDAQRDGVVGGEVESFYAAAGRLDAYEAQLGLRLVRVTAWRKRSD